MIGATDATDIFAGLTSGLFMDLPGTNTGQFTFFSADFNDGHNLLQGTSGPITADLNGHLAADDVWSGAVGNNELVGGVLFSSVTATNNYFPEGGFDSIFLESSSQEDIWFAQYDVGHSGTDVGVTHTQAITDLSPNSFSDSFVNNYSFSRLNVSNFTLGNPFGFEGDVINVSPHSWANGTTPFGFNALGLVDASGSPVSAVSHDANMILVNSPGNLAALPGQGEVVQDGIADYSSFTNFSNALKTAMVGNINFVNEVLQNNSSEHQLLAVNIGNDVHIVDVFIQNFTGSAVAGVDTANNTSGFIVNTVDLIDLVGVGNVGNMLPHNLHFLA